MREADWAIVVPVKGTAGAKSRLGGDRSLAEAIALDTVAAAVATRAEVIVVTPAAGRSVLSDLDVAFVDDPGGGLVAAVVAGLTVLTKASGAGSRPTAVLLGDLPALLPAELAAALATAAGVARAFVADAAGTGTTLLTATRADLHDPHFGPSSRARHLDAGYVELSVPAASGLRCDVDTPADLAALALRLGPATAAALSRQPGFDG